jgi:hypothetical protein
MRGNVCAFLIDRLRIFRPSGAAVTAPRLFEPKYSMIVSGRKTAWAAVRSRMLRFDRDTTTAVALRVSATVVVPEARAKTFWPSRSRSVGAPSSENECT